MKKIKHLVFWPPFLLVLIAAILSFTHRDAFTSMANGANEWLIANFGWVFSVSGFIMVLVCVGVYFSPLGKVRIGGTNAKPLLSFRNWFAITLTTTIAAGITFWGIVEPIYHLTAPPASLGIEANSPQAALFAMSTMYLHWTITPYAIYCVPALMFAFAYYNMRKPFSLSSTLTPLLGDKITGKWGKGIDAICLYTLALGMAAAMGTSILNLAGGVNYLSGLPSTPSLWAVIAIVVMVTFVVSASTGLMKGIRILSDINFKLFFVIILFLFLAGPTAYLLNLGTEAFGHYLSNFFDKSLFTGAAADDQWPQWWTTFYWANWFSWAAITALFLGRIAYGQTVRAFILVNFALPALFGGLWMTIFSGTSIYMQMNGAGLGEILANNGPEAVLYAVMAALPLAQVVIPVYLFIVFIAFVTAADSTLAAMGGISSTGISPESPEPGIMIKVIWGVTISVVAWVMISFAQIDGIKMLSNLGGVPAVLLGLMVVISLIKVARSPEKYDMTITEEQSEEQDEKGVEVSNKEVHEAM
ncbi:choline-glycine betaine transporter [Caldalkalibacillus uzonensis]|uniref:Choline-glycine betaine transporter n=1 Tax=Caldalkalibacillus uzonensis TaxID=353224 RepID=A0ABU0CX57_9BACI|nr:BCCT family transporter [Caldalkalibacillus uzonensis]MDQ0340561.1 choline-glycine betaine transporter [Caldalkalibacillus uzonensis]